MELKLKKLIAPVDSGNYKATTHATGKIGFSKTAAKNMNLDSNKYLEFAINENKDDDNLYVFLRNESKEGYLKIKKAGQYFHINAKGLLEQLELDYKSKRIIFDITEISYEGETIYKFDKREKERKKK